MHLTRRNLGLLVIATLAGTTAAQTPSSSGEVTKLDKAGGRITLKHDGVKPLDMPPMTMVFRVADPKMLDPLNVGDRIRFTAERINGQYTLTAASKAP